VDKFAVAMRKVAKALDAAVDAAQGKLPNEERPDPRDGSDLERRVHRERAAARHVHRAIQLLEEALHGLKRATLAEAAKEIAELQPEKVPLKHRLRAEKDELVRHALLEELRRQREHHVAELIAAKAVRWDAELPEHPPVGTGMDERAVELPLAFEFLGSDPNEWVLDAGASLNLRLVRTLLGATAPRIVHLTQTSDREIPLFDRDRAGYVFADIRRLPFQKHWFDRVLCVSTLEHVGMDNTRYGAPRERDPEAYLAALHELRRVLRPGGTLFLTVPVGVPRSFGWFRIFGPDELRRTLRTLRGFETTVRYFIYDGRWRDADESMALSGRTRSASVRAIAAIAASSHHGRTG
jgi:SAM-dependent methyltransferase